MDKPRLPLWTLCCMKNYWRILTIFQYMILYKNSCNAPFHPRKTINIGFILIYHGTMIICMWYIYDQHLVLCLGNKFVRYLTHFLGIANIYFIFFNEPHCIYFLCLFALSYRHITHHIEVEENGRHFVNNIFSRSFYCVQIILRIGNKPLSKPMMA